MAWFVKLGKIFILNITLISVFFDLNLEPSTISFEYRKTGSYFNSGNMVMFNGDGSADSRDWVLFNFGNLRGGDFNPKWTQNSSGWAFFGGEFDNQSASTSGQSVSTAYIWGFSDAAGWIECFPWRPDS